MSEFATYNCKRLVGKVAVVTASTDGIGLAIVERLALEGARVVVSSRKQANVEKAAQQLLSRGIPRDHVLGVACHVGKQEDRSELLRQTVAKFGGVDILVSNAGVNPYFGLMLETPEVAWDKIFDVNVKSTFYLVKEFVPYIEKRGGGSIVLVSSIGGFKPEPHLGAYTVSKTAMLGMTKALSYELGPKNININGLAPGLIKTRMSEALWSDSAVEKGVTQRVAMKRIGEPHECAGLVAFLVSGDSSYVTGENIVVSGGDHARL